MLNQRQRYILRMIIECGTYVRVCEIAERCRVSERSIRYDLQEIEYFLEQCGYGGERHKQRGVRVIIPEDERRWRLLRLIGEPKYYNVLSPTERRDTILGVLFRSNRPVHSRELAALLHVTRRTISDDFKSVKKWLEQHCLTLRYISNKGYCVHGNERDIRLAMAALIPNPNRNRTLNEIVYRLTDLTERQLMTIREIVLAHLRPLPYDLTDFSLDGIVFHIAVAVQRLRKGYNIAMPERELYELRVTEEFVVSMAITEDLSSELHLEIPEAEAGYIALHLLGSKMLHENQEVSPARHSLQKAVGQFIRETGARLGTDLSQDKQLRDGLIVHLRPTLYRLKYNLRLENPLREEIMKWYADIVEVIKVSVRTLENAFNVSFNDHECAFLAIHIGASLERQAVIEEKPRVLLVCGSGIGTAQLLSSRLRRYFPELDIVDTRASFNLTDEWLREADVDWIISTIPIHQTMIPHIVVNPFLTAQDRQQISTLLHQSYETGIEERVNGPVLEEVLVPELIMLDVEVQNWEEAVRQAGQLLVGQNLVEPRYVDAMVNMVKESGPYIVIDQAVAMPHARPENGAKALGFCLLRLKTPIAFGHEEHDPVKLVVCLSSVDAEMHLNALRQLAHVLGDDDTKKILMTADKDSILRTIHAASKF